MGWDGMGVDKLRMMEGGERGEGRGYLLYPFS